MEPFGAAAAATVASPPYSAPAVIDLRNYSFPVHAGDATRPDVKIYQEKRFMAFIDDSILQLLLDLMLR